LNKTIRWIAAIAVIIIIGIQFIRPGKDNPPINPSMTIEAQADFKPPVSNLIKTSCFDCHSNETRWPWYSYVAPVSWFVADDVKNGRDHLNFSEWGTYTTSKKVLKLGQIYEQVSKSEMPLSQYLYIHADARLTSADRDSIVSWTEDETDKLSGGN